MCFSYLLFVLLRNFGCPHASHVFEPYVGRQFVSFCFKFDSLGHRGLTSTRDLGFQDSLIYHSEAPLAENFKMTDYRSGWRYKCHRWHWCHRWHCLLCSFWHPMWKIHRRCNRRRNISRLKAHDYSFDQSPRPYESWWWLQIIEKATTKKNKKLNFLNLCCNWKSKQTRTKS